MTRVGRFRLLPLLPLLPLLIPLACAPVRPGTSPASTAVVASDPHGTLPSGGGIPESAAAFQERIYDYRFTIDPAALARMNASPAQHDDQRIYIPATLVIDGRDLGQVGVRYKGAWGTLRTCLPNPDGTGPAEPYAPTPAAACPPVPKFPYKVSFDQFVPGKRFHGLGKINLHNMIRDPSQLHERLASQLYRDMGIPAARSSFARVTVNGVRKGLYAVTEDVGDGRFTRDHWPSDPDGNLYKQGWPRTVDPKYWAEALATNRRRQHPGQHDQVIAFAADMLAAGDDPTRVAAVLERWTDAAWLARYMAVDTALRNVDGITKLSCPASAPETDKRAQAPRAPEGCYPGNNFYWYQTRAGRFLLLPWDLDYTWRVRVRQNRLPPWDAPIPGPNVPDCRVRISYYGSQHQPPACEPVFRGIQARRPLYIQAVRQLLSLPGFQIDRLRADVDRLVALIAPEVAADPAVPKTGPRAWPTMIALLKHDIGVLRARMEAVAAGEEHRPYPPTPDWEPLSSSLVPPTTNAAPPK